MVLEHLLEVCPEARALILVETTARSLSVGGPVVMFRGHARLQPGNQSGVNAVAREAPELPRYLAFARSAATMDHDPRYGFLWTSFLRALADQTLPAVNPRPALFDVAQPAFGPGRAAMPVGSVLPTENSLLPLLNLDTAADVVNNFLAAWEHHHDLAIRDGRNSFALDEGRVARVEFPAAAAPAAAPAIPACVAAPAAAPGRVFMLAAAPHVLLPSLPPVVPAVVPPPVVEPAPAHFELPVGFAPLPQQDPAAQTHLAFFSSR